MVEDPRLGTSWRALAAGRVIDARNGFAAIVMETPERGDAWIGLTLALWRGGDRFAALGAARKALDVNPDAVDAPLILAGIQRQVGDIAGARGTLEAARERYPDQADLLRLLADVYRRARQPAEALAAAQRALEIDGSSLASLVAFGDALVANERYEGAEKAYRIALALDRRNVGAAFGLGQVALKRADWTGAQYAFEAAREIAPDDPDIRYNLALLHARFGRYAEAVAGYPAIMNTASDEARYYYHHEGVPLWRGDDLAGRRLVIASDQGLGDHLMMARYFTRLAHLSPAVVVETPPPLFALFRRSFPQLRVERFTHWQPAYTMDVHLPITQLPCVANLTSAADIDGRPYLRADPARVADWRTRFGHAPNVRHVGIVWHGNPKNARERWRGTTLDAWAPLATLRDVRFHSLQVGAGDDELAAAPFPLLPTHRAIADMEDTAAAMTALDAIVTVDTSTVHLAGALGRPTWLANPLLSDFRWGIDGETTPWYASVRIVRQRVTDEWGPVFQTIATALAARDVA